MMMDIDPTPIDEAVKKFKPRFRYKQSLLDGSWFWAPMNYNAETIWLMKVCGHTNTGRRFKQ